MVALAKDYRGEMYCKLKGDLLIRTKIKMNNTTKLSVQIQSALYYFKHTEMGGVISLLISTFIKLSRARTNHSEVLLLLML